MKTRSKFIRSLVLTLCYAEVVLWGLYVFFIVLGGNAISLFDFLHVTVSWWWSYFFLFGWTPLMIFGVIVILNLELDIKEEKDAGDQKKLDSFLK